MKTKAPKPAKRSASGAAATAPRHVALLRGVNIGRAKRIAMADLRALVEGLGYQDARTLLNSGNVVFGVPPSAPRDPAAAIERALLSELGLESRVFGLSATELAAIVDENPLRRVATEPTRLLVAVLHSRVDRARFAALERASWKPEAFALGKGAAYLWCPAGQPESPLVAAFMRAAGKDWTIRNWATMTKLAALLEAPGAGR